MVPRALPSPLFPFLHYFFVLEMILPWFLLPSLASVVNTPTLISLVDLAPNGRQVDWTVPGEGLLVGLLLLFATWMVWYFDYFP